MCTGGCVGSVCSGVYWVGCECAENICHKQLCHCEMNSIIVCGNAFELPFMTSHIQW